MRIGAIGDLTLDILISGLDRIPRWGQEVQISESSNRLGGNIGNMAVGAAALGADFEIFSIVGRDEEGDFLLQYLRQLGFELANIEVTHEIRTSKTYACLRSDGERFLMTYKGTLNKLQRVVNKAAVDAMGVVFLGGWCSPPHVKLETLIENVAGWQKKGKKVVTDLIWSDEMWEQKADLIKYLNALDMVFLNEVELYTLTGVNELKGAIKRLWKILNLDGRTAKWIVKLGKDGAVLIRKNSLFQTEAYPVRPVDTVGAGDLFNIGFLHAFFQLGMAEEKALMFASTFASVFISRHGRRPPDKKYILNLMPDVKGKCIDW